MCTREKDERRNDGDFLGTLLLGRTVAPHIHFQESELRVTSTFRHVHPLFETVGHWWFVSVLHPLSETVGHLVHVHCTWFASVLKVRVRTTQLHGGDVCWPRRPRSAVGRPGARKASSEERRTDIRSAVSAVSFSTRRLCDATLRCHDATHFGYRVRCLAECQVSSWQIDDALPTLHL